MGTETKTHVFERINMGYNDLGNEVLGMLKAYKKNSNLIIQDFHLGFQNTPYDMKNPIMTWIQATKTKNIIDGNTLYLEDLQIEARSTNPEGNYIKINGYRGKCMYIIFTDHNHPVNETMINQITAELKEVYEHEGNKLLFNSKLYLNNPTK